MRGSEECEECEEARRRGGEETRRRRGEETRRRRGVHAHACGAERRTSSMASAAILEPSTPTVWTVGLRFSALSEPSSCVQRGERSVGPLSSVEGRGLRARLGTSARREGARWSEPSSRTKMCSAVSAYLLLRVVVILGTLSGELVFVRRGKKPAGQGGGFLRTV